MVEFRARQVLVIIYRVRVVIISGKSCAELEEEVVGSLL
jgi:hypothetical protein